MRTILISYDLGGPETSTQYEALIKYIKSYQLWAKPLDSFWLIKTDFSAVNVRDAIRQYIDENDKILVMDVTADEAAWSNLPKDVANWIKNNL